MIIALFPHSKKPSSFELGQKICTFLQNKNITVVAENEHAAKIGAEKISSVKRSAISFLVSMGGDGSILRLSRKYSNIDAAILGVNLGNLGFMADISPSNIYESLQDLLDGNYSISNYTAISVKDSAKKNYRAVNDVVIHRSCYHSLVEISIHVDDKYLNTFIADGVVIATPNGSTAYSLSAGGPILSPELSAFVITPICAHTISNRPYVLPANHTIKIQYLSKRPSIGMYVDGVESYKLKTDDTVLLEKCPQSFKLVKLKCHDYYHTLRSKLGWVGKLYSHQF